MEKDLLEEYNLEDVRKRMMQISEYSFKTGIVEDDEDNQQQPQNQNGGQMPMGNQGGGMQMQQPQQGQGMDGQQMGQDQMGMGQDPNGGMPQVGMDGQQMPDNGQMGMEQQDAQMSDTANMPPADDMGGEGGDMPMGDDMSAETEPMGEDDEVIDVDDLTQSQEATEYKIDGVDDKLTTILQITSKFEEALKNNEEQLAALKQEIEKRNPTPEEKMNIRSQASYPYGESPKAFWDKKSAENPTYNVIYDNDIAPQDEDKEFEIKRSDLDNIDTKSLSDSLEFPKELRDYLDF